METKGRSLRPGQGPAGMGKEIRKNTHTNDMKKVTTNEEVCWGAGSVERALAL